MTINGTSRLRKHPEGLALIRVERPSQQRGRSFAPAPLLRGPLCAMESEARAGSPRFVIQDRNMTIENFFLP